MSDLRRDKVITLNNDDDKNSTGQGIIAIIIQPNVNINTHKKNEGRS